MCIRWLYIKNLFTYYGSRSSSSSDDYLQYIVNNTQYVTIFVQYT